ncbi:MAG: hypothetical protein R2755_28090 [Acidimicrobiales bacterium]
MLVLPSRSDGTATRSTYYSHVIPDVRDVDAVRAMVAKQCRKEIERAARRVAIEPDRRHRRTASPSSMLVRPTARAVRTADAGARWSVPGGIGLGKVLALGAHVPGRSGPVAALFMVWDERRAYYLLGGLDHEHAPTQAAGTCSSGAGDRACLHP